MTSASSPFWQGEATGLRAYRLSVFGELPRTGLPELFADAAAHARFVAIMTRSGAIADASFLWWSLRPSIKFPTLELRIADACTRLDDSLCIAALFRCLVRLCVRRRGRGENRQWRRQGEGGGGKKEFTVDHDAALCPWH